MCGGHAGLHAGLTLVAALCVNGEWSVHVRDKDVDQPFDNLIYKVRILWGPGGGGGGVGWVGGGWARGGSGKQLRCLPFRPKARIILFHLMGGPTWPLTLFDP